MQCRLGDPQLQVLEGLPICPQIDRPTIKYPLLPFAFNRPGAVGESNGSPHSDRVCSVHAFRQIGNFRIQISAFIHQTSPFLLQPDHQYIDPKSNRKGTHSTIRALARLSVTSIGVTFSSSLARYRSFRTVPPYIDTAISSSSLIMGMSHMVLPLHMIPVGSCSPEIKASYLARCIIEDALKGCAE